MKIFLLGLLGSGAKVVDGLVGIITLNSVNPNLAIRVNILIAITKLKQENK